MRMRRKNVLFYSMLLLLLPTLVGDRVTVILARKCSSDLSVVERVDDIDNDGAVDGDVEVSFNIGLMSNRRHGCDSLSSSHRNERPNDKEKRM
jgi:hypothetical protein